MRSSLVTLTHIVISVAFAFVIVVESCIINGVLMFCRRHVFLVQICL